MLNFLKLSHKSSFLGDMSRKKLTFWETVSDEIPKSSFFRRLVAESFQIKDWLPIPVRPAAGDFDHIMMTMTVAIMMMTIVIIFMMVIMISQTTMMSPTCSSTSVQTISWMFNAEILYLTEFDLITVHGLCSLFGVTDFFIFDPKKAAFA